MATKNCTSTCKTCGSDFTYEREEGQPGRLRRYCSDACKKSAPEQVSSKECRFCKQVFKGPPRQKYCSITCRGRYHGGYEPSSRVCLNCGTGIPDHVDGKRKYCSEACLVEARNTRNAVAKVAHDCAWCGTEFVAPMSKKYCSAECRKQQRNKRVRDSGKKATVTGKANCQHCGVEFEVRKNTGGLYCSRACNLRAVANSEQRKIQRREETLRKNAGKFCEINDRKCIECGSLFTSGRGIGKFWCCSGCAESYRERYKKWILRMQAGKPLTEIRICPGSGQLFVPTHLSQMYASHEISRRVCGRAAKSRRRAMKRTNGRCDLIDPVEVFESVGYVCQGCGKDTDSARRGTPHPDAPELDHIVPLSKGGTHTWGNVTLLCRACNQSKSDEMPDWIDDRQATLEL